MPPELSPLKKNVTTATYKCYHFCQYCLQQHYHSRGQFFTGPCQAIDTLPARDRVILLAKGFPTDKIKLVAGMCPDCRYKLNMAVQFRNQARPMSGVKNLPKPNYNFNFPNTKKLRKQLFSNSGIDSKAWEKRRTKFLNI
jgi:hypothetical protein